MYGVQCFCGIHIINSGAVIRGDRQGLYLYGKSEASRCGTHLLKAGSPIVEVRHRRIHFTYFPNKKLNFYLAFIQKLRRSVIRHVFFCTISYNRLRSTRCKNGRQSFFPFPPKIQRRVNNRLGYPRKYPRQIKTLHSHKWNNQQTSYVFYK